MEDPKPVSQLDVKNLEGLFFDLDDTFTTQGKITPEAYEAAWKLYRLGKILVPLTGRPAGWCDHIARMWPVHAVIGENGAFYCMMKQGRIQKYYTPHVYREEERTIRMAQIKQEVLAEVPGAGIASDQPWREFDLAIDHSEDVPPLPRKEIEHIVRIFRKHGANVRISSIHVNGWFGDYDKLTAVQLFAQQELGMAPEACRGSFAFVGDSPNDEPLFSFFERSIGVANVRDYATFLKIGPAYITQKRYGMGFVELAERILAGS